MRMQFVTLFMTLLPLVFGKLGEHTSDLEGDDTAERPSRVHMWVALMDSALNRTFCGASILDETRALTLARCVFGKKVEDFQVVVYPYTGQRNPAYSVKSVIFRTENSNDENDLAVIVIEQKFRFNNKVNAVCLPHQHSGDEFIDKTTTSLAWRRTTKPDGFPEDILYHGHPLILSNIKCESSPEDLKDNVICSQMTQQGSVYFYGGEPVYWTCPKTGVIMQIGIVCRMYSSSDNSISMLRIGGFLHWIALHADDDRASCEFQ